MSASLRKLKAIVLGHNTDMDSTTALLQEACIPVSTDDCRACADPCDQGHEEYSSRFDVDMETQMLGSVKPYRRQFIVSTGKTDWAHDVTSVSGSLAAYLDSAGPSHPPSDDDPLPPAAASHLPTAKTVAGVFSSASASKTTIINGSHHTLSDDPNKDTVLVLPDYKVITDVDRSMEGAASLWHTLVGGDQTTKDLEGKQNGHTKPVSYTLPYACVILLCSHKKRDNRCAIAAPKLEASLTSALEREHWEVHTQLSEPHTPPASSNESDRLAQLKDVADSKSALILKTSHIGGHKFAGNVIIYTPQGTSVWYGRVTPHHVDAIVRDTILGGKIIPELLRGGLNLARSGPKGSLNDW